MAAASGGVSRFYFMLGAAAIAGAAAIGFVVLRQGPVSIPVNPGIQVSDTSGFRGYLLGSETAPLEVTEYADYECPACQQWAVVQFPTIQERLIRTGKVRWRYRDFPLDMHPHARTAAHAAACAEEQGKYWEMNERIYSWEPRWPEQRNADGVFRGHGKALRLDISRYDECMSTARYAGRIEAGRVEGAAAGVGSTPTFMINNRLYPGAGRVHYDMLKALLDSLEGPPAR